MIRISVVFVCKSCNSSFNGHRDLFLVFCPKSNIELLHQNMNIYKVVSSSYTEENMLSVCDTHPTRILSRPIPCSMQRALHNALHRIRRPVIPIQNPSLPTPCKKRKRMTQIKPSATRVLEQCPVRTRSECALLLFHLSTFCQEFKYAIRPTPINTTPIIDT